MKRPWTERFLVPALGALLTNPREQLWAGITLATVAVIAVAPSGNTHSAKAPSGKNSAGSYASAPNKAFATATANTPTVNTPTQPHSATRPLGGPLPAETEAEKDDFGVIH